MAILTGLGFCCYEELLLERELGLAFEEQTPRGSWPAWVSISVFAGSFVSLITGFITET